MSSTKEYWQDNDVFFNYIGTTRHRAGGAKEFINIELGISNEAAKMAANANIPHASLISLRVQTIISNFSFNRVSIFKPGMLIRLHGKQIWLEQLSESKGFGLRVDTLASAMIRDAERVKFDPVQESSQFYIGNKSIKSSLKL